MRLTSNDEKLQAKKVKPISTAENQLSPLCNQTQYLSFFLLLLFNKLKTATHCEHCE